MERRCPGRLSSQATGQDKVSRGGARQGETCHAELCNAVKYYRNIILLIPGKYAIEIERGPQLNLELTMILS